MRAPLSDQAVNSVLFEPRATRADPRHRRRRRRWRGQVAPSTALASRASYWPATHGGGTTAQ